MTPFAFEKRYCHLLGEDGTVLIVVVAELRLAAFRWARVSAECHFPDGRSERDTGSVGPLARAGEEWTFRGGHLTPAAVRWQTPRLAGTLQLTPRHAACSAGDPLLSVGRGTLRWIVEVPDADAKGEIGIGDHRVTLAGRAYRDYLALDVLPGRLGLETLVWGHTAGSPGACWWLSLSSRAGSIDATWRDGRRTQRCDPPPLDNVHTLIDQRVADLPVLRVPPFRQVARWLVGNPHQQRWVARARVGEREALAVHERVRWGPGSA